MRISNSQYVITGALCLLFAMTGGIGGYNLKSRMQDSGKPELTTGLPVLQTSTGFTSKNIKAAVDCETQTTVNTEPGTKASTFHTDNADNSKRIKQLIKTINSIAARQRLEFSLDSRVKTETEFLNIIDYSPGLINPLLDVYHQMPDTESKELLRSLLTTTGSNQIQQRAIEYLQSGEIASQANWLALLRDTGVHSTSTRNTLFNVIQTLSRPRAIHDAILAVTPQITSSNERLTVVNQLSTFLNHTDELVRSAAVETLSKWADNSHASVIEQALTDLSDNVRYAAISASYSSPIRSGQIESMLFDLMNNSSEDLQMRIHAYRALSNYSLQGQNHDQYYQFHQQLLAIENTGEARG